MLLGQCQLAAAVDGGSTLSLFISHSYVGMSILLVSKSTFYSKYVLGFRLFSYADRLYSRWYLKYNVVREPILPVPTLVCHLSSAILFFIPIIFDAVFLHGSSQFQYHRFCLFSFCFYFVLIKIINR